MSAPFHHRRNNNTPGRIKRETELHIIILFSTFSVGCTGCVGKHSGCCSWCCKWKKSVCVLKLTMQVLSCCIQSLGVSVPKRNQKLIVMFPLMYYDGNFSASYSITLSLRIICRIGIQINNNVMVQVCICSYFWQGM